MRRADSILPMGEKTHPKPRGVDDCDKKKINTRQPRVFPPDGWLGGGEGGLWGPGGGR